MKDKSIASMHNDKEPLKISRRELTVLQQVAMGNNSEQIGKILSITKTTVQTHRRNMLKKTGFTNTQQLVGWAYREKLLQ